MAAYLLRRLGQALIVVWLAFTLTFAILYMMPSDPAAIIAAGGMQGSSEGSEEQLAALRAELGLDRPIIIQYLDALWGTVTGDWGTSYQSGKPVLVMLGQALPLTLSIALLALPLSIVGGLGLALLAVYAKNNFLRQFLFSLPSVGASIPTFLSALMLVQIFSFTFRLFPAYGSTGFQSTVLPAIALAIPISAIFAQVFGKSLRTAMSEPYLDTARAKGVSRGRALLVHAARNAFLPVLTMIGMVAGALLAGTVVIETVFGRQGFGRMTVEAVNAQDIPVVQGVVVFSAIVFVVTSLIVDLVYSVVDPRIRTSGQRKTLASKSKVEAAQA